MTLIEPPTLTLGRLLKRSLAIALPMTAACAASPLCPAPAPPDRSPVVADAPAVEDSTPSFLPGVPRTVVRQHNHLIDFGPYTVEVDATDGGRIVAFALDGQTVVVPRAQSPDAYGSSIWPSPQSDWKWPPPPAFDRLAWQARVEASALVLESGTDEKLQLAAEQRIVADLERELLKIDITLFNRGNEPRKVAPWQNTRVGPSGLTFYPSSRAAYDRSSLLLTPEAGIVWFAHDPRKYPENVKLYGDGDEGWVAHVDGDLVFVKIFPDVPEAQQAPGEGVIILYVASSGRFVEVEQQGAYTELLPGAASKWEVEWVLRRLPPGITAEPGQADLVAFVRGLVAAARR